MNNQTIYWVWIQQVGGYGNVTPTRVREHYTFAEDFYRASYEEKAMYLGINERKEAFSEISRKKMHDAGRILDYCEKNNIEIIVPGDVYYPKQLLPLRRKPPLLQMKLQLLQMKLPPLQMKLQLLPMMLSSLRPSCLIRILPS